mgnify:CR=1 FL=1
MVSFDCCMYTEVIPTVGVNVYPNPPVVIPIGPSTASEMTAVATATDVGEPPVNTTVGGVVSVSYTHLTLPTKRIV